LKFFSVNPLDAAGAQQQCLAIAASKPFMVLDVGALSAVNASNCVPTAKVPFASQYLTPDQLSKYYPYYLQLLASRKPISAIASSGSTSLDTSSQPRASRNSACFTTRATRR
jgi:hypothetical protein